MFKNEFQGGAYFEIFSAQGKDHASQWKLSSSGIKRIFDKEVKSYVYTVEGSAVTTKMSIPKDSKGSLTLIQRYLILQLFVPKGQDFSIDLGVSDLGNQKRRLVLSTTYRETQTNPLHCKIPLGFLKKAKWLNLCLHLPSLVSEAWHNQTYQCIESLCIAGNCRLRRIFTMKNQPIDTTDDEELYCFSGTNSDPDVCSVPRQCQLAPDVSQDVQVITMTKVRYYEGRGRPPDTSTGRGATAQVDSDLNSSGGKKSCSAGQDSYHIAFGTKISVASQPRKSSGKDGSSTSRQSKNSHPSKSKSDTNVTDGSVSSRLPHPPRSDRATDKRDKTSQQDSGNRDRKNSDPGANTEDPDVCVDKDSLRTSHTWTDGADNKESIPYVKPHPPREPSSEKRRRPRVKSAGKERTAQLPVKDESSSAYSSFNSSHSQSNSRSQSRSNSGTTRGDHATANYQQPVIVANDDEVERILMEMQVSASRDYRRSETESEPSSHNTSGAQDGDDSISEVIHALNDPSVDDESAEYAESEGDEVDIRPKLKLYTFSSKPKSVPRGSKLNESTEKTSQARNHRTQSRKKQEMIRKDSRRGAKQPEKGLGGTLTNSSEDEDTERTPRPAPSQRAASRQAAAKRASHSHAIPTKGDTRRSMYTHNELVHMATAPIPTKSPHASQTRMSINRRSLREIPKDELRKSGTQKPYDSKHYQMVDLSDSFEARMLESMRREQMEGASSSDDDDKKPRQQQHPQYRELDSLSGSSDETEMSTLKSPTKPPDTHNYQDEMQILSQEFLTHSNPRDLANMFSPPIRVHNLQVQNGPATNLGTTKFNISPKLSQRQPKDNGDFQDGQNDLDLLYDPVLNCYFDPKSGKYYELL